LLFLIITFSSISRCTVSNDNDNESEFVKRIVMK